MWDFFCRCSLTSGVHEPGLQPCDLAIHIKFIKFRACLQAQQQSHLQTANTLTL